jgi:hypothetical protein
MHDIFITPVIHEFHSMMTDITSTNAIVLLMIIVLFGEKAASGIGKIKQALSNKDSKTKPTEKLQQVNQINKSIAKILDMYREQMNAGRASLCVFHNGGHDILGISFLKFSCVEEVIARGVIPKIRELQCMHIQIISKWIDDLLASSTFVSKQDNDNYAQVMHLIKDTEVIIVAPVWNGSEIAGFISLEWSKEAYIKDKESILVDEISRLAKIIEVERSKIN